MAPANVQPTKVEVTASAPTPVPVPSTPTAVEGRSLSELDDRLAERTAEGFLQRLASDEAESAARLYLSDGARQGNAAELLAEFSAGNPMVREAALVEFRRATASTYEARALLRLIGADGGDIVTQTMTLRIVYQGGLWVVDDITLGDQQSASPTLTRRPSAGRSAPKLDGRLVFQVSSGGDIYVINTDGSGRKQLARRIPGSRPHSATWRRLGHPMASTSFLPRSGMDPGACM
jgi:hypothetical protein